LLSFYANLNYLGAPCPNRYRDLKVIVGDNYDQFVLHLRKMDMKYFLWEEKHWQTKHYDFLSVKRVEHFIEVGHWNHPDNGMLILFEVT
jgi:hypothetical protein